MNLPAEIVGDVLSSFVPGSGPVVERAIEAAKRERERNQSVALAAALRVSRLTREDLAEQIADNPRLVPLLTRLLYTAAMTGRDELLQTLGAAFGHAAAEPDAIDTCEAILTAASALQPNDVRVLRASKGAKILTGNRSGEDRSTQSVAAELDLSVEEVDASLERLATTGLVNVFHGIYGGGSSFVVSEHGAVLCDLLAEIATPT